jgi:DNA-binding XRE family transcriptional regulator
LAVKLGELLDTPFALIIHRQPLPMISPSQIRGARAMLRLTQAELAEKAGLSKVALIHIEAAAGKPKAATLAAIQRTLEIAGVEFTEEGPPGVRLRK